MDFWVERSDAKSGIMGWSLVIEGRELAKLTTLTGNHELVGGDWNMTFIFPFSWECHFFRGVGTPPTR